MMWIIGADSFVRALSKTSGGPWLQTLTDQFRHVPWEGLHFYDLIMPLFLFMVGVAIPYSLDRILAGSATRKPAAWRILRRTLLLLVLGWIYAGGFSHQSGQLRLCGTLQRIAVCYCAASFIYLCRPGARTLLGIIAGILLGYWALLALVPAPGFGAGDFAEGHNLANWFDARFLPGRKWNGDHDPEGPISTVCAISTVLIGVFAGRLLRDASRTPAQKAKHLVIAGIVCLAIGFAWSFPFPVIKKIWTSSYVMLAGGYSLLFLAAFHWLIDMRNLRAWATPFVWMGTNALAIYVISNFMSFSGLVRRVVSGPVANALDALGQGLSGLTVAALSMFLCFWFCRFLYQRKIFLRL